jgi:hypothetical protein
MNKKIVVNTSPIISFGKMQAFDLIRELPFKFVCPPQVQAEISVGTSKGYPVIFPDWIKILPLKNPLSALVLANLDAGEAAVIELALQENIAQVCLDEIKGRRAAMASGLNVVGSLGLLGKAKTLGIISELRPLIEKAQKAGIYYDKKLVENFLTQINE